MAEPRTKRTRDPVETRRQILSVSFDEVYSKGFQSASINDIVERTGLTKGAFFHYFPTKNDLGYAIVDEIITGLTIERWIQPLSTYSNPVKGIVTNLKKVLDSTPEEGFLRGCPLNNLTQEMSPIDPMFHQKLKAVLNLWMEGVKIQLDRAKSVGFLARGTDTRALAEFIVTIHEGSFGMAKALQSSKIFRHNYTILKDYLESLSPG